MFKGGGAKRKEEDASDDETDRNSKSVKSRNGSSRKSGPKVTARF
jgi:hypothetical protein